MLVVGRGESGREHAAFEAAGLAYWADGKFAVRTHHITPLVESEASLTVSGGGQLTFTAGGIAGATIRWVARVEPVEVAN